MQSSVSEGRDQEQFDGEGGVGRRLLGADPIRVNLPVDFDEEFAPIVFALIPSALCPRRHGEANNEAAGKLGNPMVVGRGMERGK